MILNASFIPEDFQPTVSVRVYESITLPQLLQYFMLTQNTSDMMTEPQSSGK